MPMLYKKGASSVKTPHIANNNAFLGDVFTYRGDLCTNIDSTVKSRHNEVIWCYDEIRYAMDYIMLT